MNVKQLAIAVAACGVVTLIGVLLPWAVVPSVDIPSGPGAEPYAEFLRDASRTLNRSGTQGFNGTFVLILGLVGGLAAGAVAFAKPGTVPLTSRQLFLVSLGAFALGLLLTFIDLVGSFGPYSRGIGIYLTFLATLAGGAAAFLALQKTPAPAPAQPPRPA